MTTRPMTPSSSSAVMLFSTPARLVTSSIACELQLALYGVGTKATMGASIPAALSRVSSVGRAPLDDHHRRAHRDECPDEHRLRGRVVVRADRGLPAPGVVAPPLHDHRRTEAAHQCHHGDPQVAVGQDLRRSLGFMPPDRGIGSGGCEARGRIAGSRRDRPVTRTGSHALGPLGARIGCRGMGVSRRRSGSGCSDSAAVQLLDDCLDLGEGVSLVVAERSEIGLQRMPRRLELPICQMDRVHDSTVGRRTVGARRWGHSTASACEEGRNVPRPRASGERGWK